MDERSQNGPKITIKLDDPAKAGQIDTYQTPYELVIMGQFYKDLSDTSTMHFKNRVYVSLKVNLIDYCWITTIKENNT